MKESSPIITYEHHGVEVSVREHLKGRHREHCLCWQNCEFFFPNDKYNNCPIAMELYDLCVLSNVTTPVWECSKYSLKGSQSHDS